MIYAFSKKSCRNIIAALLLALFSVVSLSSYSTKSSVKSPISSKLFSSEKDVTEVHESEIAFGGHVLLSDEISYNFSSAIKIFFIAFDDLVLNLQTSLSSLPRSPPSR